MKNHTCQHCGGRVEIGDATCFNCGIPLPPNHGKHLQRTFLLWFIALVIFCAVMILWLPPDWTRFMER